MAVTRAARVIKMTAGSDEVSGRLIVGSMEWDGSTTADDDLIVTDGAGNEIWVVNNKATNERAVIYLDQQVNGIICDTIDAGTLYIYLR